MSVWLFSHILVFFFLSFSLFLFFSFHKLGTITYHNLSKVMKSYDKRVAVFPIFFFFPFFFFFFFFFSHFFLSFSLFLFSSSFYFFNSKWTNGTRSFFRHDSRRSCFNERGAATPWQTKTSKHIWRLPELVDTMQFVVRVKQRTVICTGCSRYFWVAASASKTCLAVDGGGVHKHGAR